MTEFATSKLNRNMKIAFLFQDIVKSYDRVWHSSLIHKITHWGPGQHHSNCRLIPNRSKNWGQIGPPNISDAEVSKREFHRAKCSHHCSLIPVELTCQCQKFCRWYRYQKLLHQIGSRSQEATGHSRRDIGMVQPMDGHQCRQTSNPTDVKQGKEEITVFYRLVHGRG